MKTDGNSQTRLARSHGRSMTHPYWSADGRRTVFAAGTWTYNQDVPSDAEIYVMNADGTDPKRLTANDRYDGHPSWSPDASQIAFESLRDGTYAIYVMQADGSNPTRITYGRGKHALLASWSPHGKKIVFQSERDGSAEIYGVDLKGEDETRLTWATPSVVGRSNPPQPCFLHWVATDLLSERLKGTIKTVQASMSRIGSSLPPDNGIYAHTRTAKRPNVTRRSSSKSRPMLPNPNPDFEPQACLGFDSPRLP